MGVFNKKKIQNVDRGVPSTEETTSFLDLQAQTVNEEDNTIISKKRQSRSIADQSNNQLAPEQITKTFNRLGILEQFKNVYQPLINKIKHDLDDVMQKLTALENADVPLAYEANQARKVLDSADGMFKNAKEILINASINANKVWDLQTQTYRDVENIKIQNAVLADRATTAVKAETAISSITAQRSENATNADNATNAALAARATIANKAVVADALSSNARVDRADVAERILFRSGDIENYLYMDDILNSYISKETLKDLVRVCETYEAFKNLVLNNGLRAKFKKT